MGIEVLLAFAALVVAVVGTVNDDLSHRTKLLLIAAGGVTCLLAIFKAVSDDRDKNFMKVALISTLSPSNSEYNKLSKEVFDFVGKQKLGFDEEASDFHHGSDGMTFLLRSNNDSNKHATLVFNRTEIGKMYADQIESKHNDSLIKKAFDRQYSASTDWDEEFVDEAGILGAAVCFNMFHRWATEYDYDPSFGLKLECEASTGNMEVQITKDELSRFHNGNAPQVFYKIEQRFRDLYKGRADATNGRQGAADGRSN